MPAATSSQQRGVHLAADRRRERVDAEPAELDAASSLYPSITPMTEMLPIDTLRSGRPVSPDSGSSLNPTGT